MNRATSPKRLHYVYSAPSHHYAAGRVVWRQDAAGVTRYGYDGNVTQERDTVPKSVSTR